MKYTGTYDKKIFYNPANRYCIISVKTSDKTIPENVRSSVRQKDHLIRFIAVGYELPLTDAVELELEGDLSELLQHEYDHLDGILATMRAKDSRAFYRKMG